MSINKSSLTSNYFVHLSPSLLIKSTSTTMTCDTKSMAPDAEVTGHKLSTVVPVHVTGDLVQQLSGIDLAMKLHYLKSVYYYKRSDFIENLTILNLKEPTFSVLDLYYQAAGRIRRNDNDSSGRPYIKCNDSGVRTVEAECSLTMDEWLENKDLDQRSRKLVPDTVLGPDLFFSPLVTIQFTWFKCGGIAVGMNWAHVLGDAASASNFINLWGHILVGNPLPPPPLLKTDHLLKSKHKNLLPKPENPLSIKQVEPVGDFWLTPTKHRMEATSFHVTATKLKHLQSKISNHIPAFEAISSILWKTLGKIRVGKEPTLVTIVRNNSREVRNQILSTEQIINTVATNSSLAKLELSELAMLISSREKDQKEAIKEVVDKENGKLDFTVYGANLTFVDMQGIDLYGLQLKGQKPVLVDYSIDGVGDEGAVLVLQDSNGAKVDSADGRGNGGRVVTVILSENEIPELRKVLDSEWGIA